MFFTYFPIFHTHWIGWRMLKVTFAEKPWNISKSQKTSQPRRHPGSPHEFHRSATRPAEENCRCLKKKRFIWRKTLVEVFFVYNLSLSLGVASIYKSWTILRFLPIFCENNSGMTDDWATHLGSSSQTCSTHLKHIKQIILSIRDEKAQKHQKPWAWGYQALCHYWSTLW